MFVDANSAQSLRLRPPGLVLDNNKELPPPPPPKSPRHNAFLPETRDSTISRAMSWDSGSIDTIRAPSSIHSGDIPIQIQTHSAWHNSPASEIYELPAAEETTVSVPSPIITQNAATPKVPSRKPVANAPTPKAKQLSEFPAPPVPKARPPSPDRRASHAPEVVPFTGLEVGEREQPQPKPVAIVQDDKGLPPPPPKDNILEAVESSPRSTRSSLLKRRNPSTQLQTLDLEKLKSSQDDEKLEVLTSAVYTPPTKTPRSGNKSRLPTPLLDGAVDQTTSSQLNNTTHDEAASSDLTRSPKQPLSAPLTAPTSDLASNPLVAHHFNTASTVTTPAKRSSQPATTAANEIAVINSAKTKHESSNLDSAVSRTSAPGKALPPLDTTAGPSRTTPTDRVDSLPSGHPTGSRPDSATVSTPASTSDIPPSLDIPRARTPAEQTRPTGRPFETSSAATAISTNEHENRSDAPWMRPKFHTSQVPAGSTQPPPRYRAISPDSMSRDARQVTVTPMSRALSPDSARPGPRPDALANPARQRPMATRPRDYSRQPNMRPDRPFSPDELRDRSRHARQGPVTRPLSPEEMRYRSHSPPGAAPDQVRPTIDGTRHPRPHGPLSTSRPLSPDQHPVRPPHPRSSAGRPMSPSHGIGNRSRGQANDDSLKDDVSQTRRRRGNSNAEANASRNLSPEPTILQHSMQEDHTVSRENGPQGQASRSAGSRVASPTPIIATPDVSNGSRNSGAATSELRSQFLELVNRSVALHERYAALRTERQRLSTLMATTLREPQSTQELIDSLTSQNLAINTVNSSIDICLAKLKAIDCRKEEVIARFIFAPSPASIDKLDGRASPQVAPLDEQEDTSDQRSQARGSNRDPTGVAARPPNHRSSQESSTSGLDRSKNGTDRDVTLNGRALPTLRNSDVVSLKTDSTISIDSAISPATPASQPTAKSPLIGNKPGPNYSSHDILDSYYDD